MENTGQQKTSKGKDSNTDYRRDRYILQVSRRSTWLTVLLIILIVNSIGSSFISDKPTASAAETTVVKVEPALLEYHDYAVGQEFTVAVKIANVTDLYGFNIRLRWNATVLDYASHSIHVPRNTFADGVLWNPTMQLANTSSPTDGTYWIAYSSMSPAPSFNGSGTVFTIKFRIKYHPREPASTVITKLELYVTELAAFGGGEIPHTREHGSLILYAIPLAKVKVNPETTEYTLNATGQQFTATVKINVVKNLYHFGILFTWNTTLLEYVSHSASVPKDTYPEGVLWSPVLPVADEINIVDGTYHIAYSSLDPAPSFNGSGTIFTVTFRVRYHPEEPEPTAITKLKLLEAELFEADYTEILHTKEDGTVILRQIPKSKLVVEPSFIEFGNSSGDEIPIPGTQFSVAVKIHNVTNLYGFDLKLRWNTTYFQYVSRSVRVPKNTYVDGVLWNPVLTLADSVDPATGIYWIACSSLDPAPSFNGSGTIFTMIFQVTKQAYDFETGTPAIEPVDVMLDFSSAEFAERGGKPMTLNIKTATVRIWERSFQLPPNPALKVMPVNIEKLPLNSNFDISIWIIGLNSSYDIASFNITLNYNSTLIEATSLTKGAWPESYAQDITEIMKLVDNAIGKVTYALELVPPRKPDPPTTGILFTVSFRVIYESSQYPPPSTELALSPTNITDRVFGHIMHIKENGTYTANRPPPKAKFTWSPSSYFLPIGQPITFNASESYHPLHGSIKSYQWDFGDGTREETTTPITSHTYSAQGTVTIVLNVTDYGDFWDTTSATLYIVEPPPRPDIVAEPTLNKFGPYPPQVVGQPFNISIYIGNLNTAWSVYYARFSLNYNTTLMDIMGDQENVTISHLWKGPNNIVITRSQEATGKLTCTLENPTVIPSGKELLITIRFTIKHQGTYPTADTSLITLSDIGLTGSLGEVPVEQLVHAQIVIRGLTSPLKASFTFSPASPKVNDPVTLNASDSTPEARIANYTWNFGDNSITTVTGPTITHQFLASRIYNVTLTVTDIEGLSNANWETITVEPRDALMDITPYLIAAAAIVILSGVGVYLIRTRRGKKSPKQLKGKSLST